MPEVKVVNKYKDPENSNTIPIHRGSQHLGNPYPLEEYANDREVVLDIFKEHFLERLPRYQSYLRPLIEADRDIELQCFCAPLACHGHIYQDYIRFVRHYALTNPGQNPVIGYREKKGYKSPVLRDGLDHINVYSRGETELGRLLSNFAHTPFETEPYGRFESMEGYWYYVATGYKHEVLKTLHGYKAKEVGRAFESIHNSYFEEEIEQGIRCKLEQNPRLMEMLMACRLPLQHYYSYGNPKNNDDLINRDFGAKFIGYIQSFRAAAVGGEPTIVAGSRTIKKIALVRKAILESGFEISSIITGMAKGIDILSWHYGKEHAIHTQEFKVSDVEWKKTKAAGIIRNGEMEKVAKQAIVLVENNSPGSMDMIKRMKAANKKVFDIYI